MGALLRDLRFAARMLAKSPGYTLVAVMTLALAIGANTAIFSTVNAVLLRPLPYDDPDELVIMWETHPSFEQMSVSYPNYLDYRKMNRSFVALGAFRREGYNLTGQGEPEVLPAYSVSHELLPMLGVEPILGRVFLPEEDAPDGRRTVLLSEGLWQRRFAGDPNIVGKTLMLSSLPYEVIGVLPADFRLLGKRELVVPLGLHAKKQGFDSRGNHPGIFCIGRLADGVTLAQAREEMNAVGAEIERQHPDEYGRTRPAFDPLHTSMVEDVRPQVLTLFGAVVFVLLIAAANVANLMLARALTRHKEMAIRGALGAGRWRLIRLLLVESTLLALLGGGLGLLLAMWGVDLLAAARPQAIEQFGAIDLDGRVLGYTLAIALATGLLFGLAPALHASREDLGQALKEGDQRATAGGRRLRVRNLLVIAEVALALVLLVGAGLSIRNFVRLQNIDPGFAPDGLLTLEVSLPSQKYAENAAVSNFREELLRRVAAVPGVESYTISGGLPFAGASETSFDVVGQDNSADVPRFAVYYAVGPRYFETMKIPLLRGRYFDANDKAGARAIIIDQAFAEKFFPDQDPLGKQIDWGRVEDPKLDIVGVVRHVAHYGLEGTQPAPYQMYIPLEQVQPVYYAVIGRDINLTVRAQGDPRALARQLRAVVSAVDPEQPVASIATMNELVDGWLASRRFTMFLLVVFAGLALVLAAVGLYAVMANAVTQRTHELGVRMALGAQPGDVIRLVIRQGLTLVGIGVAVGLAGAVGVGRALESLLAGVDAADPLSFGAVVLLLLAVALLATYIPARRATKVDPMVALRHE